MAITDRVHELVQPIVADSGAEIYDIQFTGGVLQVLIESEGGIDIATIKTISRSVSRILDEVDPIPGRYTFEVSSPGLERPLRTADHFRRAVGELIKLKTSEQVDGARRFIGTVETVDDDGFELAAEAGSHRFAYHQVSKANIVFEWGPTPKKGGKKAAVQSNNSVKHHSNKEPTPS